MPSVKKVDRVNVHTPLVIPGLSIRVRMRGILRMSSQPTRGGWASGWIKPFNTSSFPGNVNKEIAQRVLVAGPEKIGGGVRPRFDRIEVGPEREPRRAPNNININFPY